VAPPAPAPAPPRRPPPEPFTHPLLAQAERPISHEDCSRGALWSVAQQIRGMHKEVARGVRMARNQGKTAGAPGGACQPPALEDLAKIVRGPLQERVGGCVGRDGPYDPEWDMVNSGVLSLGVCLDCSRPPEQRAGDCKHALEAIDRAQKAAEKGTVEKRMVQARGPSGGSGTAQ
jgi:hypothetical protein